MLEFDSERVGGLVILLRKDITSMIRLLRLQVLHC